MRKRPILLPALIVAGLCLIAVPAHVQGDAKAEGAAALIKSSSGVPGGICVLLGQADTDLAVAMAGQGQFTVQALYSDKGKLAKARQAIRAKGVYGAVSADASGGKRLPYTENLINIVVADGYPALKAKGLSLGEIFRVLTPLGCVYLGNSGAADNAWTKELLAALPDAGFEKPEVLTGAGTWVKARKPWPDTIDEFTHYLHGADGNPVAMDRTVGPPVHYQWQSDPLWARSHETDSSVRTLVTAGGRLFYIFDQAPISLAGGHDLPDDWCLMARDAFNGVFLWKVPIKNWGWRQWKTCWFSNRPGDIPFNIQKRLVATADHVYITLGYHAPVSRLDARTGKILQTYQGTERTAEILLHDGTLILTVLTDDGAKVMAVDADSGKTLWTTDKTYAGTTMDYVKFGSKTGTVEAPKLDPTLNTATDGKIVALLDGMNVVGIDFKTGKEKWRTEFPDKGDALYAGGMKIDSLWVGTTIVKDGVVLHASPQKLVGFSADTGEIRWAQPKKYIGHLWYAWKDVFVIDGLAWTWSDEFGQGKYKKSKTRSYRTNYPVSVKGYDLQTGELKKEVSLGLIFKTYHHHRCYRNKATSRYILASRRGTEYVDLEQGKHTVNNWVRGTCHVGMMPANGLQYAPPHPCACYIDEKLYGFNALAPEIPAKYRPGDADLGPKLERGPAYGAVPDTQAGAASQSDWPAFRHDATRSGAVKTKLPAKPKQLWREKLGGKVGPAVAVGDKVFVPLVDAHHILALNAADGSTAWEFAAGGRIDSPPTYHKGALLFGSTDGWVYCVRASDGALAWRFRAAPAERRMGAFGQLESAWPVNGSVLVQKGVVYFAAGRSSHLDGGITIYGLDPATGEVRHKTTLEGPAYNVENVEENYRLPMGALPDILTGDGEYLYMRTKKFDAALEPQKGTPALRRRAGFLDDAYFKRVPWTFGKAYARLIVHDDEAAYFVRMFDSLRGLDATVYFTPGKEGYLLFSTPSAGPSQIKVANSKSLNQAGKPLTVEAWVKAEGPDGAIVAKGGSATGYALSIKDGKPRFEIRVKNKVEGVNSDENILGKWTHLIGLVTKDKQLELYVNGKLARRAKASSLAGPSGQAMEIGADLASGAGDYESPYHFTGIIDDVRVYRRTPTPGEIAQYCGKPGQARYESELTLHFSFDDGAATDASPNANNGEAQSVEPVDGKVGKALKFVAKTEGWKRRIPVRVRAMALTDDILFTAGPPDEMDLAAFRGEKGGILNAIDRANGETLSEIKLPSPPVLNGVAAANGRLILSLEDGSVVCFGE